MTEKPKTPWMRIFLKSLLMASLGCWAASVLSLTAVSFIAGLFLLGGVAGAWGRFHGWLTGIPIGLSVPLVVFQGWAGPEAWTLDFWRIAVPAAFVSSGVAIAGSLTGAWLRHKRLRSA